MDVLMYACCCLFWYQWSQTDFHNNKIKYLISMYGAHPNLHTQTRTVLASIHATSANKNTNLRNNNKLEQIKLVQNYGEWHHQVLRLAARTPRSAREVLSLDTRTPRMGVIKVDEVTLLRDPTLHWISQVNDNTQRKWYHWLIHVSEPRLVLVMK